MKISNAIAVAAMVAGANARGIAAPHCGARAAIALRSGLTRVLAPAVFATALIGLATPAAFAAAAVGDVYVYRVINGYITNSDLGKLRYKVEKTAADRIEVSVTADNPRAGYARSGIYTKEGNWLRHPISSHDQPVDYEFATAFPAYLFPLEPGKNWSQRFDATAAVTRKTSSIRVDGEILGVERIAVPAGTFEVIKVMRRVYAGDHEGTQTETTITETDWYSPALGRAVRSETKSEWMDSSRCGESCRPQLGDWLVYELVETSPPRP